jgi:hypothetical protein
MRARRATPLASLLAAPALLAACEISPVVTPAEGAGTGRYDDCARAARDYCRDVRGLEGEERRPCEAELTYECTRGPR